MKKNEMGLKYKKVITQQKLLFRDYGQHLISWGLKIFDIFCKWKLLCYVYVCGRFCRDVVYVMAFMSCLLYLYIKTCGVKDAMSTGGKWSPRS